MISIAILSFFAVAAHGNDSSESHASFDAQAFATDIAAEEISSLHLLSVSVLRISHEARNRIEPVLPAVHGSFAANHSAYQDTDIKQRTSPFHAAYAELSSKTALQHVQTMYSMLLQQSEWKATSKSTMPLLEYREQKQVFMIVVCLTCCLVGVFSMTSGKDWLHCPVSLLACFSCIFFGIDNFLMAFSSCYLRTPSAHAGVKFVFDGVFAITLHNLWLAYHRDYRSGWDTLRNGPLSIIKLLIATGMFTALGQLTGNIGFNLDPKESGPHQALACSTVLVVAPFFYYYCNETLSKVQILGCAAIFGGVMVMSDIVHWEGNVTSVYAFIWVLVSMFFYAASVITWRLAAIVDESLPWKPQVLMIFGSMGCVGALMCPGFLYLNGITEYLENPLLFMWPVLNAIVSFLGMWCLQLAFQRPEATAGAITAVVDSNSIAMLTLNRLILGLVPSFFKGAGMTIILVGVMVVCCEDFVKFTSIDTAAKTSTIASTIDNAKEHTACEDYIVKTHIKANVN